MKNLLLLLCIALSGCPSPKNPKGQPTSEGDKDASGTAKQEGGEIGLVSVRLAALSEQEACVFGGWICLSGEQIPLLRCTSDGGKTFSSVPLAEERCAYLEEAQVSRDGKTLWLSCAGRDGSPYLLRSDDAGKTFSSKAPLSPRGSLVAWSFVSKKTGIAVIAAEGADSSERHLVYIE